MTKCLRCGGTKKIMGMGFIQKDCPECNEVKNEKQDDGKQNQIESTKDFEREAAMDQSTPNNLEAERQVRGEDTSLGTRSDDLQERKRSRKGREKK